MMQKISSEPALQVVWCTRRVMFRHKAAAILSSSGWRHRIYQGSVLLFVKERLNVTIAVRMCGQMIGKGTNPCSTP
jgi:hypothetical protein